MDSRTLQILADQAQQEADEANRREREVELQLKLVKAEHTAKRATLRLLRKEICDARLVRNILIPRVFGSVCMSVRVEFLSRILRLIAAWGIGFVLQGERGDRGGGGDPMGNSPDRIIQNAPDTYIRKT